MISSMRALFNADFRHGPHDDFGERRITAYPLQVRLRQVPVEDLATTIISYEEQVRGWLSHVSQAKTPERLVEAYKFLQQNMDRYSTAKNHGL